MLTKKHDLLKSLAAVTLKPKKRSFPTSLCTYDSNVNKDLSKGVKVLLRLDCNPHNVDTKPETTTASYPIYEQPPFRDFNLKPYPVKNVQYVAAQLQTPFSQPIELNTFTVPDLQKPVDFGTKFALGKVVTFNNPEQYYPFQPQGPNFYVQKAETSFNGPLRQDGYFYSIPLSQWQDNGYGRQ